MASMKLGFVFKRCAVVLKVYSRGLNKGGGVYFKRQINSLYVVVVCLLYSEHFNTFTAFTDYSCIQAKVIKMVLVHLCGHRLQDISTVL